MSFCHNCGKIKKQSRALSSMERNIASLKRSLESGLSQGKRMFDISHKERETSNRIAKLQEAFFILENAINMALKKL